MKKYLLIWFVGIIFFNVSGAGEVSAQSSKSIDVEIEFDFRVGDKLYPAGDYRLESVGGPSDNVFRLRGANDENRQLIVAQATSAAKRQSPKLVFRQLGDQYYLAKIFLADGRDGFSLPPSRRQTENGKKLARAKPIDVPAKNRE